MGPDDRVQRVVKTGVASAGAYDVSIAVWVRSGRFFAEARVFARSVRGLVGTLRAEGDRCEVAVFLLESKVGQQYGLLNQIQWESVAGAHPQVGQRVWVADGKTINRRKTGVVASIDDALGFVVRLDGGVGVVTCSQRRCGVQWGLLSD